MMARSLVQTCISREGRAALTFGLGVEGFQEQGQVRPLFASPLFFSLNGAFTGCLEKMLLVFPTSTPHPLQPGQEKPGAEAFRLALDCSARTFFPKWAAGVSQAHSGSGPAKL